MRPCPRCLAPFAVLSAIAASAAGCSFLKPVADNTHYYVLSALPPEQEAAQLQAAPTLGLGPVTLPEYLERPELVSRPAPNQLHVSDRDLWGEPLADGVRRVLREDLVAALGKSGVRLEPSMEDVDLVLRVEVLRFEPVRAAYAELQARWSLHGARDRRLLATEQVTVREPIAAPVTPASSVAALSRAVARFAADLARAIRAAAPGEPRGP